jgi:hypothetical protein
MSSGNEEGMSCSDMKAAEVDACDNVPTCAGLNDIRLTLLKLLTFTTVNFYNC